MLLDKLTLDLNTALKSGDKIRTETLRFLIADIKKFEIDNYPPASTKKLTDQDIVKIIRKQVKNRRESIAAFKLGNRQDLVDKETQELKILETYLPQDLTDDEIRRAIREILAKGIKDFGPVMGLAMKQFAGRADGQKVQELVKLELANINKNP